jgi:hypothetical protein
VGFKVKRKYFSKWELKVSEVSNNYWEGVAKRTSGNIVSCQGSDPEEIMRRLENDFWEIELKLTNNSSNLLSTYLKERADYEGQKVYLVEHSEHFGSWTITKDNKQIIYDGKEHLFVLRVKANVLSWKDKMIFKLNEISPEKVNQLYTWLIG